METSLSWLDRLITAPADADWKQLLAVYGPLLSGWLSRLGVSEGDRDDLVQEVLMVVVREVGGFEHRRPGAFRGWLRTILGNRVRDYFRQRAGHAIAVGGSESSAQLEQLADPNSALSKVWDREHDEHIAARALERIRVDFTEATWQAFIRQALEGRSAQEVAGELGLSLNAVLIAKSRILRRLRAELAGWID